MFLESKLALLRDRAKQLALARKFFATRNILEVDPPVLSHFSPIDEHIDVMQAQVTQAEKGYLQTSPEYAMKRLLAAGLGDMYYLGHVFRQEEQGSKHNPEFTMAEWYRLGFSFDAMIEETLAFIRVFLGPLPAVQLTYRQTLQKFANLDYLNSSKAEIFAKACEFDPLLSPDWLQDDKDSLLQLLLTLSAEPHMGQDALFVLTHYPATQAALARTETKADAEKTALRFEIYHQGVELANGYYELTSATEQRKRLLEAQERRKQRGKDPLDIDEYFLSALTHGLPDCTGVAVGFDRILMLKAKASHIKEVIPFAWDEI